MKVSYKKLQEYFLTPLPSAQELADLITSHAWEVESVDSSNEDWLMEIKVLPDRAADAKTPAGLAMEVDAILGGGKIKPEYATLPTDKTARAKIKFTASDINSSLGLNLSSNEIENLLRRVRVAVKDGIALVPPWRPDINLVEDLADEVGRLYGVNNIPSAPISVFPGADDPPELQAAHFAREILAKAGYTEIYGYSLRRAGDLEVARPLSRDLAYLRADLTSGLRESLAFNLQHVLFDQEPVKLFEIGAVFPRGEETVRLGVAVGYRVKSHKKESLPDELSPVKWPRAKYTNDDSVEIIEIEISELVDKIDRRQAPDLSPFIHLDRSYQPVSQYPRIIRDIALWVGLKDNPIEAETVIRQTAGEFLVGKPILFDDFIKSEKRSLAFRLVFQSPERTLSDDEVNKTMNMVVAALDKAGLSVRG